MKKSISAKRVGRSRRTNSSESYEEAERLAETFHGREVEQIFTVLESYKEPHNLAVLGMLEELVVNPFHSRYEYPISFEEQNKTTKRIINVCSNSKGEQIYFVGGHQDITDILEEIHEDGDSNLNLDNRVYVILGHCISIAYFADKHHLAGPKYQAKGASYEHEFGEDGGIPPILVFDKLNKRLMLFGGTYHIEDRGIVD